MIRLVIVALVRIVGRCIAVAELLRRRLVSLRLRVCWGMASTPRCVVALGWRVGLMGLVDEFSASVPTVESADSSGEKSEREGFHCVFYFYII